MNHRNFLFAMALSAAVIFAPAPGAGANRHRTYEDLADTSDKVVIGTVGVKASHWGDDSRIYTEIVISPDATIKGDEEGPVTVRIPGGTVGDTTMTVSDGPQLSEGGRMVLFLRRDRDHYQVAGRAAGSIAVDSPDASEAVEQAFGNVERRTGRGQGYRRGIAWGYLRSPNARASSPLASNTSTAAAQTGCYSIDGAKWGGASATYKIGASVPAAWTPGIDAATAAWNDAGVNFRLVKDASSVNELSLVDLVAKYGSSYSNTYAVTTTWSNTSTGQISRAIIEINSKWQWSTSGEAGKADVQNIMTHEFGHWMRLLDIYSPSTCSEATMFGTAALGETKKRTLEQADIDGFKALYSGSNTSPAVTAPVLASPANGIAGVSSAPTLSWGAVTSATAYDVYFGTNASPAQVASVAGTTYQPGTLSAGTTFYWRVVARNSTGSATSATWSFSTAATTAPTSLSAPVSLSPANGATGVSLKPLMQWTAVQDATAYDLYVGTTPSPGLIGTVSVNAVTVSGFRSGTTYYWKVVARNAAGSASSRVSSFRTQ